MEYIPAKTIVTHAKNSQWFGIEYNMNIYRGCCHGCIYCDSRSECYGIQGFDQVRAKEKALEIIRNDLRRKVRAGVVGTGAMSDPYNPFEEKEQLTRHALELVDAYGFGAAIATKSDGILRDIDILQQIQEHSPVLCKITVTTADDSLCQKIEPGVAVSSRRFEVLKNLGGSGLFAGILLMPVLPFLEDSEENVREIVYQGAKSGVRFIYPYFGVTLRQNQRQWYLDHLEQLFPSLGLRERYQAQFGESYQCVSPKARRLWEVFTQDCKREGILYRMGEITEAYKQGYQPAQLSFF